MLKTVEGAQVQHNDKSVDVRAEVYRKFSPPPSSPPPLPPMRAVQKAEEKSYSIL